MWTLPLLIIFTAIALSFPFGRYLAWIMDGKYNAPRWLRWIEARLDTGPQNWKQYSVALLMFSTMAFLVGYAVLQAQALLPLVLIAWNEQALASGTHVTLKTAPVDPVDPFRGRYVTLSYEISSVPTGFGPSAVVYVPLSDGGESWVGGTPTSVQPDEGVFIRGRVGSSGRIEFGIERYFTDEEVCSSDFTEKMTSLYRQVKPLHDFLNRSVT